MRLLQTEEMRLIKLYVHSKEREQLIDAIIKSGVFHLIEAEKVDKSLQNKKELTHYYEQFDISKLKAKVEDLVKLFEIQIDWGKVNVDKQFEESKSLDVYKVKDNLDNIFLEFERIESQIKGVKSEIERLNQIMEHLSLMGAGIETIKTFPEYRFLEYKIGEIDKKNYENFVKEFEELPVITFPLKVNSEKVILYIIYLKRDRKDTEDKLKKFNFQKVEIEEKEIFRSKEILKEVKSKLEEYNKRLNKLLEERERFIKTNREFITDIAIKVKILELKKKVKDYFLKTKTTFLITGWVPAIKLKKFIKIIEKVVGKNYYLEVYTPEEIKEFKEVPVVYTNPSLFKPFESLTYTYGVPAYKTINPVPFVALTYLIMFGVMFGDVGHGFVLFLIGLIISLSKSKRLKSYALIGRLILYCGISSIFFGIMFGSVFGYEHILKPVWLRPIENTETLFGVAIVFGIVVISIGILINLINSIITKDFETFLFSKSGLIGGLFYWGMIIVVSKMFVLKEKPSFTLIFALLIGPLILFIFRAPIIKIIKRKRKMFSEGVLIYIMETLVEILELVIGYVSNTMSFIRVVAFGLAHAGLFIAIFSLSNIIKNSGLPSFLSILILILGNIGIILLEGLVVSIQAMRLEYYEFFSKFFFKTGKKYQPVKLSE